MTKWRFQETEDRQEYRARRAREEDLELGLHVVHRSLEGIDLSAPGHPGGIGLAIFF